MNRLKVNACCSGSYGPAYHCEWPGYQIRRKPRVADLLARLPADNQNLTARLMEEMYSLGDEGTSLICRPGSACRHRDDTKARYAVSTLTAHLTADKDNIRKSVWEKQCIRFMESGIGEGGQGFLHEAAETW